MSKNTIHIQQLYSGSTETLVMNVTPLYIQQFISYRRTWRRQLIIACLNNSGFMAAVVVLHRALHILKISSLGEMIVQKCASAAKSGTAHLDPEPGARSPEGRRARCEYRPALALLALYTWKLSCAHVCCTPGVCAHMRRWNIPPPPQLFPDCVNRVK